MLNQKNTQGASFKICLPASERKVIKENDSPLDVLKGMETILLIEDEEMVAIVTEQMLAEFGYEVILAKSGEEAIAVFQQQKDKIDLVILDMILPDITGGETFDRLKSINSNVKVLLSSGYSIDGQANEILERGCNGFIQKPYNLEILSKKLREILEKG